MKTTIELPDELLIEAKAVAARRRTTLRAMVEHALRREIMPETPSGQSTDPSDPYEVGPLGILRLKRRDVTITNEDIRRLRDEMEDEELQRALAVREGKCP